MSRKRTRAGVPLPEPKRCAIYTRKSTAIGLEQEFNSLDAQREACEKYIEGQGHQGWRIIPEHYDDGGFTGVNLERPAFMRLMDDMDAGKLDVIVVYKVDRLSRSLLDSRMQSKIGRTIHQEIRHFQIERMKHLLANTDLPIKRVAREVGFQDVAYMTRVFGTATGTTPGKYRKQT